MGVKVALGMVVAVMAATSVGVPASWADETGLADIHVLRREHGRLCMADHWHYGSSGVHRSRRVARRAAIRAWQDFVDLEYGSSWARYYRAHSRRMRCSRASGGWSCDVEGRPCR